MKNIINKIILLYALILSTNLISMDDPYHLLKKDDKWISIDGKEAWSYNSSTKKWTNIDPTQYHLSQDGRDLFKLENKEPKSILENFKKFLLIKKLNGEDFEYVNQVVKGKFTRHQQFLLKTLSDEDFKKLNRYIFITLEKLADMDKELELSEHDIKNLTSLIELLINLKKFNGKLTNSGRNFLSLAYVANIEDLIDLLIRSGSMGILSSIYVNYLLETACADNKSNIVKLLIRYGAWVDSHNGKPLISAASKGNKEIVELLIRSGAKIGGITAVDRATKKGHKDIVELLKINGIGFKGEKPSPSHSCAIV